MLVRLIEATAGKITFEGRDITKLNRGQMRPLRQDMQIIFQDPYSSLNPRHTVGKIIAMPLEVNGLNPPGGVRKRVQELLEIVGLNPEHYNRYPHEFSGGQRQRIGIARALALRPKLIVADEPVSALDVSIQAQVVNLLRDLQRDFDLAFVFIAHDLAVVRHFCQRVAVMYLGKVVEMGTRQQIYEIPAHPYTRALLSAVPDVTKLGTQDSKRIRLEGRRADAAEPPVRLPLPYPVLEGPGKVRGGRAATAPDRYRPEGRLSLPGDRPAELTNRTTAIGTVAAPGEQHKLPAPPRCRSA